VSNISGIKNKQKSTKNSDDEYINRDIEKLYESDLKSLLRKCYQCARCSGVCQLSKVQKFTPSRIIQNIIEGNEEEVIKSGVLWDCLTCNLCLQNCPQGINFADIVRIARYKMVKLYDQNPEDYIAHKGIYTTISDIMSQPYFQANKSLKWVPKGCKISDKGNIMYYVGCLPFFGFEFENLDNIAASTLKMICKIEKEPIVVLKEETCCGHDIYWGQGKLKTFSRLANKNLKIFEKTGVSTIITACAECYRTFKVDYNEFFEDFSEKFEIKHIIEYIYEKWKEGKIEFKNAGKGKEPIEFTFHDPCRLSRFLPKENTILDKLREIFKESEKYGYHFKEMKHNKENALCCGVNSWMNCTERSKALRYKRMLEAKEVAMCLVTSCPKCNIHLTCVQEDLEEVRNINILDFSEFLVNHIRIIDGKSSK